MDSGLRAARQTAAYAYDYNRFNASLRSAGGVVAKAARQLGISREYFFDRAKVIGLDYKAIRSELGFKPQYELSARSVA